MKVLELFEPAAIDVSDEDARMDAVIQALVNAGETVKRYDIIGMKKDFAENEMVENLLDAEGPEVLPITLIDGVLVKQGGYPSNTEKMCIRDRNTRTAENKSLAKGAVTEDNPVTGEFQMSGNMVEGSAHGSCSPGTASQKSYLPVSGYPAFWDICNDTIEFFVE